MNVFKKKIIHVSLRGKRTVAAEKNTKPKTDEGELGVLNQEGVVVGGTW